MVCAAVFYQNQAAAWPKLAAVAAFGGVACGQLAVSVVTRQNGNSLLR